MKKGITYIGFPLLLLGGLFALGPKASFPNLETSIPTIEIDLTELDGFLADRESTVANLKPGNQARIVWADSIRKTEYSVVYLHGFSASGMEGFPVHTDFAKRFGCNLFIPRLYGHGIKDQDAFADLTPQQLMDSAREALAIGKLLGNKVIVMSTSTGGTLSIYLAALEKEAIHAQILFSPNIQLYTQAADILTYPWGLQIGKLVEGERRHLSDVKGDAEKYWTVTYRMEGVVALKYLMEQTMTREVFQQIKTPLFLGYYYKNEKEQDNIVSVGAMQIFFDQVATPPDQKVQKAFPDAGHHVIASRLRSQAIPAVENAVFQFAEEVLGL